MSLAATFLNSSLMVFRISVNGTDLNDKLILEEAGSSLVCVSLTFCIQIRHIQNITTFIQQFKFAKYTNSQGFFVYFGSYMLQQSRHIDLEFETDFPYTLIGVALSCAIVHLNT
jgi:hypothetical protein